MTFGTSQCVNGVRLQSPSTKHKQKPSCRWIHQKSIELFVTQLGVVLQTHSITPADDAHLRRLVIASFIVRLLRLDDVCVCASWFFLDLLSPTQTTTQAIKVRTAAVDEFTTIQIKTSIIFVVGRLHLWDSNLINRRMGIVKGIYWRLIYVRDLKYEIYRL